MMAVAKDRPYLTTVSNVWDERNKLANKRYVPGKNILGMVVPNIHFGCAANWYPLSFPII